MKHIKILLPLLLTLNFSYGQVVTLIAEDFSQGIPSNWTHCSGNWSTTPQWSSLDSAITESSGPYFGRVLNGIQLPAVDLSSISNPVITFDLIMQEYESDIQFSIYYSRDSVCETQWDNAASFHNFANKELLTSFSSENDSREERNIVVDLSSISNEPIIFITFVSDYMNYYAEGIWELDNVKVENSTVLNNNVLLENITTQVYPNPASNVLNISGINDHFRYDILNVMGRKVLSGVGSSINVDALPNGLYFLSNEKVTIKFIKE